MTPDDLVDAIKAAIAASLSDGAFVGTVPDEVVVERPRNPEHGDYATNVAMRLAKGAGRPPREVAELIADRLRRADGIAGVDVAGPGFINVSLAAASLGETARVVVNAGEAYGANANLVGRAVNLEYVSANPTGPVHIAHARWAAVGDALARLISASGAKVTREYYFNDAGSQIDRFAASLAAAARGAKPPADGYHGEYVNDVAADVVRAHPGLLEADADEALATFGHDGVELMFDRIKQTLHRFGVDFDVYFNERDLHASGAVDRAVERLRAAGHVFEADGAVWLRTTDFGDDKDRVIVRSNGQPTYFCSDLAYYIDKRDRGADKVIILLGPDHHGYVGRMRGLVAGLGENPDDEAGHGRLQHRHAPVAGSGAGEAPNVAGPLVDRLHLPALAPHADRPVAPPVLLEHQSRGTAIHQEMAERRPRHRPQGGGETASSHAHLVAIDLDLDLPASHRHDVLHDARSNTATVSTWAVWGKRSNARTPPSR